MTNVFNNGDFHLGQTGWGPQIVGIDVADLALPFTVRHRPLAKAPTTLGFGSGRALASMGKKTRCASSDLFSDLNRNPCAQGFGFANTNAQFTASGPTTWRLRFQATRVKDPNGNPQFVAGPADGFPPGTLVGGEIFVGPIYWDVVRQNYYNAIDGGLWLGVDPLGAGVKVRVVSDQVISGGVWDGHRFRCAWQRNGPVGPAFTYDWGPISADEFPLPAWDWYGGSPQSMTVQFDGTFDVPDAGVYYVGILGGNDLAGGGQPLVRTDPWGFAYTVDNVILEDVTGATPPPPPSPGTGGGPIPPPDDSPTVPPVVGTWIPTFAGTTPDFDIVGGGDNLALYWTGGNGEAGFPSTPADLPAAEIVHVWKRGEVGTIPATAFVDDFAMTLGSLKVSDVDPDTGKRYLAASLERLSDNVITVRSFGWPDSAIHDYAFAIEVDPDNPVAWDRDNVGYDSQPVVSSSFGAGIVLALVGADSRNIWAASLISGSRRFSSWNKAGTCFQQVWESWTAPFAGSAFTSLYFDLGLLSMVEYDGGFLAVVDAFATPSFQVAVVEALIQPIPCPPTVLHIWQRFSLTSDDVAVG